MVDPYGFLSNPRQGADKESVARRLRHWGEYTQTLQGAPAARQASRCMDCGIPHCHRHCPVHNLIPDWNELVSEGDWYTAYRQLDSTNNFPEFTGRLCPAPCEDACTLELAGAPVTIKDIELAIAERAWERGWVALQRARHARGRRVAVVGSGPAGLACAQQLARAGYRVTVFEKSDRIGGLLRYGIPDFRMEKHVLERRLGQLEGEGISFRTGAHVGVAPEFDRLRRDADAVVLACGAEHPRDIDVPGRGLAGIHFAMTYLTQQNRRVAGDTIEPGTEIDAGGRHVAVIGGGDTGSDCIGTALRQGAGRVTQIQYHAPPPVSADVLGYWPERAPARRPDDHEEEGCVRIWGWDTVAFEGEGGCVAGVVLQRLRWSRGPRGGWEKRRVSGTRLLPAQLVMVAIGYMHPVHEGLVRRTGLKLDGHGCVAANDADYRTSVPAVFACGDMRRGQSLIVWAIREGRQCARAVDDWLSEHSELPRV